MERLTYKAQGNCGFVWAVRCPRASMQDVIDRLAAYEDTGLEPEDIERAQAEKDGRLVVLQESVTVRRLQEEYRKAKHMADERLPSPDYTTGRIAGFGAEGVHILDKILPHEEAREEENNGTD